MNANLSFQLNADQLISGFNQLIKQTKNQNQQFSNKIDLLNERTNQIMINNQRVIQEQLKMEGLAKNISRTHKKNDRIVEKISAKEIEVSHSITFMYEDLATICELYNNLQIKSHQIFQYKVYMDRSHAILRQIQLTLINDCRNMHCTKRMIQEGVVLVQENNVMARLREMNIQNQAKAIVEDHQLIKGSICRIETGQQSTADIINLYPFTTNNQEEPKSDKIDYHLIQSVARSTHFWREYLKKIIELCVRIFCYVTLAAETASKAIYKIET